MSEKNQNFLQRFIGDTPLRSLADAALLGYTDFDKKGDDRSQKFVKEFLNRTAFGSKEGRQAKYDESKKSFLGVPLPELGVSEFLNLPDTSVATQKQEELKKEKEKKEQLDKIDKDALNRQQFNKDLRNLLVTNTALREFEAGREAKRNMAAAQQYLQLASMAAESSARRRLMEDQFSPTKISQQRLRAQQGEAALMNAIANQQNSAVNAARSGINPRGRAGGA